MAFGIAMCFFFLLTAAFGVTFLVLFFSKERRGQLEISENYLLIPGRWKQPTKLPIEEITDFGEFNTYDHVLVIVHNQIEYLIEKQWMSNQDFEKVRAILVNRFG